MSILHYKLPQEQMFKVMEKKTEESVLSQIIKNFGKVITWANRMKSKLGCLLYWQNKDYRAAFENCVSASVTSRVKLSTRGEWLWLRGKRGKKEYKEKREESIVITGTMLGKLRS